MTFRSDNIDPNCRFCKQVKITMLDFKETSSGFEYNYTMRIGGHKYSGGIRLGLILRNFQIFIFEGKSQKSEWIFSGNSRSLNKG